MSSLTHLKRAGRAGIALAVCFAFVAVPAAAQAATTVNLGTALPFVVLGGSAVTNTGPSVLNGDLGVAAPGAASPTGFPPGLVVGGVTHDNDAVANQAQSSLTNAYNVAAGEPFTTDLSGQDLGGLTLTPGVYRFSSSAQLTGQLTLNGLGDPNAQFIFQIGSTLTTASSSSVQLINGASPCNVYWQIGSSATLGTDTQFQGNLLALTSITLNTRASVIGRALARNGAVTLDTNLLNSSGCATGSTSPPPPPPGPGTPPPGGTGSGSGSDSGAGTSSGGPTGGTGSGTGSGSGSDSGAGTSSGGPTARAMQGLPVSQTTVTQNGTSIMRRAPHAACTAGFSAAVRGRLIKRVVFSLDRRRISSRSRSPFAVYVRAAPGSHKVSAYVTFKDATRTKTLTLPYRACAAAVLHPRRGPSQFTG